MKLSAAATITVFAALLALAVGTATTPVAAQLEPSPGPALTVLVHHPFPDPADPLGAPLAVGGANGTTDAFVARYQRYDVGRDGFGYPSLVVDGVVPIEGLPDGDAPYVATRNAYVAALEQRAPASASSGVPAALEVVSRFDGDRLLAEVTVVPAVDLSGEDLRLWVAVAEDHVFYDPPAALSNGVTDHRFTVRAVRDLGPLMDLGAGPGSDGMAPREAGLVFDVPPSWQRPELYVSAWLQQGPGHGLRFDPLEVVQATTHRGSDPGVTRQDSKGVLLELYSATWCAPCLYGDTVVEELAEERGHPAYINVAGGAGARYFQAPGSLLLAGGAALAGAALVALPRFGGRP